MNLYSNAVKFTKEKGSIRIVCQYIKGFSKKDIMTRNQSADVDIRVKDKSKKFTRFDSKDDDDENRSIGKVFS
jgi:K+-sensing histidine kinase KdpD